MLKTTPTFKVKLNKKNPKSTTQKRKYNQTLLKLNTKAKHYKAVFTGIPYDIIKEIPSRRVLNLLEAEKLKNVNSNLYDIFYFIQPDNNPNLDPFSAFTINDLNINAKKSPKEICKNLKLNSFMAFRAYYSQYGEGLEQPVVSSLLSKAWKLDKKQQMLWDKLTEQYKRMKGL